MGTTSNYSWPTPEATDLVKDGWDAIKDLGDAADTTVKAVADAQGLVHINTTTISAPVASQSLDNVFTSNYDNYLIYAFFIMATQSGSIAYRLRASGTDTTTNYHYSKVYLRSNGAGFTNAGNNNAATSIFMQDVGTTTNEQRFVINLLKPQVAIATYGYSEGTALDATNSYRELSQGAQTGATSFDGITFFGTASNITSGVIRVYGVKN